MNGRAKECPRRPRPEAEDVLESDLLRLPRHWRRLGVQLLEAAEAAEALWTASGDAGAEGQKAEEAGSRSLDLLALDSAEAARKGEEEQIGGCRTPYLDLLQRLSGQADNPSERPHRLGL